MSIDELNQGQLEELRESYFYQLEEQTGDEALQRNLFCSMTE